jgi:DNA-directed RNA polymerase subunit RPC12/RpoP
MTDTEALMTCPLCGAVDILEQRGMYAKTIKCEKPGDTPREVKLRMYVCGQCGRMFNEMEAQAPSE